LEGRGRVVDINYSLQSASIKFKDGSIKDFDINDIADNKEDLSDDVSSLMNYED
jgi:hypothetical protein